MAVVCEQTKWYNSQHYIEHIILPSLYGIERFQTLNNAIVAKQVRENPEADAERGQDNVNY